MDQSPTKIRWHGLDLIRLISFSVILTFQTGFMYFYTPSYEYGQLSTIQQVAEFICRCLSFSGFSIVFLSSFLLGYVQSTVRAETYRVGIFLVLIFGWIYLSLLMHSPYLIVWDVYGLFLVGMVGMLLLKKLGRVWIRAAGIMGFILLWIPFWEFSSYFASWPENLQQIIGVVPCPSKEASEWPLLPWLGLVGMGYALGHELVHQLRAGDTRFLRLRSGEALVWVLVLAASIPHWGPYFHIRLGSYFSCDAYRQPPIVFWSHFIWVLAALRLSLEPRVQSWLAARRLVLTISNLAISRKFWLAYVIHFLYGHLLCHISEFFEQTTPEFFASYELSVIDFLTLTLVLQIELFTRGALAIGREIRAYGFRFYAVWQKLWSVETPLK